MNGLPNSKSIRLGRVAFITILSMVLFCGVPGTGAFVLNLTTNGLVQHWNLTTTNAYANTNCVNPATHAIRFYLPAEGWSATNGTAEINALRASFAQWQAVPGAAIQFEEGGSIAGITDFNTSDNTNTIFWTSPKANPNASVNLTGLLGYTIIRSLSDGTIAEADIGLNADMNWFTDFNDTFNTNYFVEGTALHEIGHFLGLSHSPLGAATMRTISDKGVSTEVGLSSDELAFAQFAYPRIGTINPGSVAGVVSSGGSPVFGAMVVAENAAGNIAAGTVSLSDGSYQLPALAAGAYQLRVCPLDPFSDFLVSGSDISPAFAGAQINFLPALQSDISVAAGATNTVNLNVISGTVPFRFTYVRRPVVDGTIQLVNTGVQVTEGQTSQTVGVAGMGIPSNATLTVTGDGLTQGPSTFSTVQGYNLVSTVITVATNATPGMRSYVIQSGTNLVFVNGFLKILPLIPDHNFDGLDDRFQRRYFPLFTSPQAAPLADPDGDGFDNYSEYVAGTDPTNASSNLRIESVTQTVSGATITWQSIPGKSYQVSSRPQFGGGAWQNIGDLVVATDFTTQFLDPAGTGPIGFYRVQVLP